MAIGAVTGKRQMRVALLAARVCGWTEGTRSITRT